jgi:hypothetical protein
MTTKPTTTVTFTHAQTYAVYSALVKARQDALSTAHDGEENVDARALAGATYAALDRAIAALVKATVN